MKRVFAHIGFSVAITLIVLNFLSIKAALAALAAAGAFFVASLFIKRTRQAVSIPLCLFSAMLACVLFISFYYGVFINQSSLDGKTVNSEFYIVDLERETQYGYYYTAKTVFIDEAGAPQNIKLTVKSEERIPAEYYQPVDAEIKFSLIADNGYSSYGSFGDGIFLSAKVKSFEVTDKSIFSINKYILDLRSNIRSFLNAEIGGNEGYLITALLIGYKSDIPYNIKDNFLISGTYHVMAVSGLHIAVFTCALYWVLKKLSVSRKTSAFIMIFAVLFYIAFTGFSKSVIRSGIMMLIILLGRLLNDKADSLNSLGFAVFVICLNPYAVTDAAALLTVTSALGLLTINPSLMRLCKVKNRVSGYVCGVLSATASVFITTFPVMCFVFGYDSVLCFVFNFVMIPLAELTLIVSFLLIVFCWISPLCTALAFIAKQSASLMIFIVSLAPYFPLSMLNLSTTAAYLLIGAVLLLFGIEFIIFGSRRIKACAVTAIAMCIAITGVTYAVNYNSINVREIAGYQTTAVIVYDRRNAVVIGVNDYLQYSDAYDIISVNDLEVSMLIDTSSSEYSKQLADDFEVLNYVITAENAVKNINCSNIVCENQFDVDLWQSLNVKYQYSAFGTTVKLTVYNTLLEVSDGKGASDDILVISTDYVSEDINYYMVNKYGFSERRMNQWLQ